MNAFGLLAKARELGVRVVQFGPNLPLDAMAPHELDEMAACARESGIEIEAGTRGVEADHLRRYIEIAKRCGATLLRSVPEIGSAGEIPSPGVLAECLRTVRPDFEDAGVRLALENTRMPAVQLSGVLDIIGSPMMGITLDTVNSLAIPEGTDHVAHTLARHALCLHVKDFVVKRVWHMMGFTVEGRPAGQGQLNVPWLLGLLRSVDRSPNAILELWVPEQASIEQAIEMEQTWAVESIEFLRRHVPG